MKEKIIKILDNYFDLSIYKGKDEILSCVASKIESLIKENYEKEFVEWLSCQLQDNDIYYERGIYSFEDYDMILNDLHQYWLENIKDK